jgi:hypothetical protein
MEKREDGEGGREGTSFVSFVVMLAAGQFKNWGKGGAMHTQWKLNLLNALP